MRRLTVATLGVVVLLLAAGCAKKQVIREPESLEQEIKTPYDVLEKNIYSATKPFIGKKYKTGANPEKSPYTDCSHLVCAVTKNSLSGSGFDFKPHYLPSDKIYDMSYEVTKHEIRPGDLMFFTDSKNSQNHVGLITRIHKGAVYFVQASSQAGVVESSTKSDAWEYYWKRRFDSFRRWKKIVFKELGLKY